jgi:hypothetical protein
MIYFSIWGQSSRNRLCSARRAEAHHIFDAGAVVPAAVEDHDLAGGRKVLHVALHVHLRLLAVGRRGQGGTTRNTRGLTRSVIALIVPPLPAASRPSKTMTLQLVRLHPFLEVAKLDLERLAVAVPHLAREYTMQD